MLCGADRTSPFSWSELDRVVLPDDASLTSHEWCPPPPYGVMDDPMQLERWDTRNPSRGMREINLADVVLAGAPHDAYDFEEQQSGGHGHYSYVTNSLTDDQVTAKYREVRQTHGLTLMPTPAPPMCKYGCGRSTVPTDGRETRHHLCNEPGRFACRTIMQRKAERKHAVEKKEKKKADAKAAKAAKAANSANTRVLDGKASKAGKAGKAAKAAKAANGATTPKATRAGKAMKTGRNPAKGGKAGKAAKAAKASQSSKQKRKAATPIPPTPHKQDEDGKEEKQWEMEKIVAERVSDTGETEFLVKWVGCSDSDSWEPESNLDADATIAAWRCVNNSDIETVSGLELSKLIRT